MTSRPLFGTVTLLTATGTRHVFESGHRPCGHAIAWIRTGGHELP
jgi:hypothetical protein